MSPAPAGELPDEPASVTGYRWVLLAGVWFVYYCFGLTIAALAPLVGPITGEMGIEHGAMGAIFGAWPLVYIASALPCGALIDRIGAARGILIGALVIAVSGVLRSQAGDPVTLFLAVAAFGLGGPLVSVGAPKVIALVFDSRQRGLAMGIYITGPALGGITALALTNSVLMPLNDGNWRTVLLIYAGVVGVSVLLWGAIASRRSAASIAQTSADKSIRAQLNVFGELIRVRGVRLVLAMAIGIFFFNHALGNWLPEILRDVGMSAVRADFWATIPTLVGVAGALIIPRLATPARRMAIMFTLFALCAIAVLLIPRGTESWLIVGLVMLGIARTSMMTLAVLLLVEMPQVGARFAGMAGGMFFSAAEIGGVLGPLVVGAVSQATGGFETALYLLSLVCIGLIVLWWLFRSEYRVRPAES